MRAIPVPQPIGDAANPANFNNKDFPTSAVREVETGDTIYPAPDPENDVLSNEPGGANATAHRQGQKTLNVGSDTLQFPLDAANPAYSGRITFELRRIETISLNIVNDFLVLCSHNHISNIGLLCFFRYM